jgi:23S rRNA C2498 (ribose-2'-O)-methylase RlmM
MVNPQALNDIVNAITATKHTFTKIWILRSLEKHMDKFDEIKPIYEALLKSDPETFRIYIEMAPEEMAKKLQALMKTALEQNQELRERIKQLAKEIAYEYPLSAINRLFE